MEEPFGGRRFVADTSAWARRADPSVAAEWQSAIRARQLLITPVVELEMLYSARDGNDIELESRWLIRERSPERSSSPDAL